MSNENPTNELNDFNPERRRKAGEPTAEERLRILKAVKETMATKDPRMDPVEEEFTQLSAKRAEARERVYAKLGPLIEAAKMRSPVDPLYLHCEYGKMVLYGEAAKMYMDELRTLSKEDAIALLSFAYAEFTLNEYV